MGVEEVRGQAREIARGWSPPDAPPSWELTAAIFGVLAEDPDLLAVAAEIEAGKLPALLFCAATCYLVSQRHPPALVGYFPPRGSGRIEASKFAPAFREFCLDHREEMVALGERRRYQMTEVARTTQVALALGAVARWRPGRPIGLIDLGTGAGLGLRLDRYRHELTGADYRDVRGTPGSRGFLGDPQSPLTLRCHVSGSAPASALPSIASRVGVDLEPLDLANPDDREWARACVPPETASRQRFEAATRIALANPARVIRGDGVEALPALLSSMPDEALAVVADTYTSVFFSNEQRRALRSHLDGCGRDAAWISLDPLVPLGPHGRESVQGIETPPELIAAYRRDGVFALLGVVMASRGQRTERLLARAHPSGTSMVWL